MSLKSKYAFRFSAENLAEMMPQLYMWTFTFAEALAVDEACKRWSRFVKDRHRGFSVSFPNCSGLRVFEMHKGREVLGHWLSHGLHIHMVVNQRLPVDIMRLKWHRFSGGPGRIHVMELTPGKEGYMAKYLGKGRQVGLEGKRLWAPINYDDATKVSDIRVDSRWTAAYGYLAAAIHGFRALPWVSRLKMVNLFTLGEDISGIMDKVLEKAQDGEWPDVTWDEICEGYEATHEEGPPSEDEPF